MLDNRPLVTKLKHDNRDHAYRVKRKKKKASSFPYWIAAAALNKRYADAHGYSFTYYKLNDVYGCLRKAGVCGTGCRNRFLDGSDWGRLAPTRVVCIICLCKEEEESPRARRLARNFVLLLRCAVWHRAARRFPDWPAHRLCDQRRELAARELV